MRVEEKFSFEKSYDIELVKELGSEKRLYFPSGQEVEGNDGLILKVSHFSYEPWIGIFAFGNISPKGVSAVCSMPDMDKLCVVSKGAGYIVSSSNPARWEEVKTIPILNVR